MSNSAVVRSLRRRFNFYFNTPIFNKYGKSLRDFLGVTSMALGALLLMLFVFVLFIESGVTIKTVINNMMFDAKPPDAMSKAVS
jgi:hypothetical protein